MTDADVVLAKVATMERCRARIAEIRSPARLDFVAAMVIKLKTLFPMMGRRRIAGFLARAGLHIAASTVRGMLNRKPAAQPPAPRASAENPDNPPSSAKPCTAIANYPNHVWGLDTTAVPTSAGF